MHDTLNIRSVVPCHIVETHDLLPVEFECAADTAGARRWMRAFRRVDRVELRPFGSGWNCTISGVGNRLPVQRGVPLRIALGFAALGRPVIVLPGDS